MKVAYPIRSPFDDNPTEEQKEETIARYYGHNNRFGFFPIGFSNTWHGGIHIEDFGVNVLAIADGRIIAYRIPEDHIEENNQSKTKYSNAFVLIQHYFKTPKNKPFQFFSLYMHLQPKKEMIAKKIPDFFAKYTTKTKTNSKERGLKVREYCKDDKTESRENHFIARGNLLKKQKNTIPPKGHWMKNNTKYVFANLNGEIVIALKSWLNNYDQEHYQIKHEKANDATFDKNTPVGTMIYDGINGKHTKMENVNIPLEVEKTKDKNWYKIKDQDHYILKKDCNPIEKKFKDNIKFNDVQNVDIPIKAGQIIGAPSKYGLELNPYNTIVHLEVFSDDNKLKDFINNTTDKDRTSYQVAKDKTLQIAKPCKFLKTNTKVKIYQTVGKYTQIGFENVSCITKRSNLIHHKATKNYYTIKEDKFIEANNLLKNLLPNKQAKVYYKKTIGADREIIYKVKNAGQKYWINSNQVTGNTNAWITLNADITSYYEKQPSTTTTEIHITETTKPLKSEKKQQQQMLKM